MAGERQQAHHSTHARTHTHTHTHTGTHTHTHTHAHARTHARTHAHFVRRLLHAFESHFCQCNDIKSAQYSSGSNTDTFGTLQDPRTLITCHCGHFCAVSQHRLSDQKFNTDCSDFPYLAATISQHEYQHAVRTVLPGTSCSNRKGAVFTSCSRCKGLIISGRRG